MKIYDASGFSANLTGSFTGSFTGDGTNLTGVLHNSGEIASDISGSVTSLSASIATRFDGLTSDYTELTNIPSGIISSSNQFNALSNTSASFSTTASYALNAGGGAGFPFSGSGVVTGSLYVSQSFISGSFKGDGSQLYNVNYNIITASTIVDSFTSAPSHSVSHNFGTKNVHISVYEGDTVFIPNSIVTTDNNTVDVVFGSIITGRIVVSKGGHLVSGSLTEETTVVDTFAVTGSHTTTHNFGTKNVIVQVYDNNDNVISPSNIQTIDTNRVKVTFSTSETGRLVVVKGGHYVTGTYVDAQTAVTASYIATASNADVATQVTNLNTSSGSLSFWQGSQTEYDAISSSADPNTFYIIRS